MTSLFPEEVSLLLKARAELSLRLICAWCGRASQVNENSIGAEDEEGGDMTLWQPTDSNAMPAEW